MGYLSKPGGEIQDCPALYEPWLAAWREIPFDRSKSRAIYRRFSGWILIATSLMLIKNPSYPIDAALRRSEFVERKIEEHGTPDPQWLELYVHFHQDEIDDLAVWLGGLFTEEPTPWPPPTAS